MILSREKPRSGGIMRNRMCSAAELTEKAYKQSPKSRKGRHYELDDK